VFKDEHNQMPLLTFPLTRSVHDDDDVFNVNWVGTRWQQYSTHLHTHGTQSTGNGTYLTIRKFHRLIWEVRAVPRLCQLYPGICLITEENVRKNLS
jgi:hypothetical protein